MEIIAKLATNSGFRADKGPMRLLEGSAKKDDAGAARGSHQWEH